MYIRQILLILVILPGISTKLLCQVSKLNFPAHVAALQKQNPDMLHYSAYTILSILENSTYKGLDPKRYHTPHSLEIINHPKADSIRAALLSDGLITYCIDLQRSPDIDNQISYDEISGKYTTQNNPTTILDHLANIRSDSQLVEFITGLEPNDDNYNSLLNELRIQVDSNHTKKIEALKLSIAYYRWIYHFNFEKCIVVNIPSATLRCLGHNKDTIEMKVVVGKPSTRTPRFAAHCNQVILYPYWHVPRSIAVNEILPACKKNAGTPNILNLQVLNSKGQVIDPLKINWRSYSGRNFPYTFRQTTGCGNALGVIKFNITDPFSVYLHDTNFKNAFNSKRRYLSHGCVRVEKPVALANFLLPEKIDESFVTSCIRGQKPVIKPLPPVPVFVVYMPVTFDTSGTIVYHDDVYKLL